MNSYLPDGQGASIVSALDDGGYVIAWHSLNQDGSSYGVYAQRYNATGQTVGGEFRVNQSTASDQLLAGVVGLPGGRFAVTWYTRQSGSWELYQRQFDASGAGGSESRITAWGGSWGPAWASQSVALKGGGYVTVWQSNDGSGNVNDVYVQRFADNGALLGAPIRVNSYRLGEQSSPTVAATADGGFVVGWQSAGQDGSGLGIYAQRFDPVGGRVGNEFRLSDVTAGDQSLPSFAPTSDGGFIATWGGAAAVAKLYQSISTSGTVQGTAGNDVLVSTSAQEAFFGGQGADVFRFLGPDLGGDAILDFQSGIDRIEVLGSAFGSLPTGQLDAGRFALNAPGDADDRFVFNTATGVLSYDPDGTGTMAATAVALLNVRSLSASDIWVAAPT
ncbi:hypothetical protein GBZ48_33915 [Azospirillum melinis]|uniref:Calcium-binding protein n=1 Tax=Azospirillum melinis TaxID=328839 RepID=A0ABX2KWC9_9PROT|nr:hypothetical protein [Azospirillum melinis]NUB04209.1 hypothetical protein [Azospirillum melinis]